MAFPYYQPNYQPYYQQQQTSGILWVSSELEAQSFPVAPNAAVALWDSTKPAVYLKQADASGRPTLKAYALTELAQMKQESQEGSNTDFAKKSDLDTLAAAISAIKSDIKALKRKQKEVEEDDE